MYVVLPEEHTHTETEIQECDPFLQDNFFAAPSWFRSVDASTLELEVTFWQSFSLCPVS